MDGFTVELYRRDWSIADAGRLTLRPTLYTAHRWGGARRAEIVVEGDALALWDCLNWLRYYVIVRNPNQQVVWAGIIVEALVGLGAAQVGVSLEEMTNKVRVAYTYTDADGGMARATTDWTQNTSSVNLYGTKEGMLSLSDTTAAQATAFAATQLAKAGNPVPVFSVEEGTGARLLCIGLWETLDWTHYVQDEGQELHDVAADLEHMLGWGIAAEAQKFGFYQDKIGDLDARLGELLAGNRIVVAGSYDNDGTYLVVSPGNPDATPIVYESDGITFGGSDDIYDSESGLDFTYVGAMIKTTGSAQTENNSTWWVSKYNSNSNIEVDQHTIVDETDVGEITIKQGHEATFEASFNYNVAGTSTTALTGQGIKIAQKFQLGSATGWTVNEINIIVRKVGSPADNLRVRIFSDSGGSPNTALVTATVAGSALANELEWISVDLGAGLALSAATDYWLVVDRTGALDHDDFYTVGLETTASYARGGLKIQLPDGATWAARDPNGHMPFQLWAVVETTTQIETMLGDGQFFASVDVGVSSSVTERPYRAGDLTVLAEVERLLGVGTSAGAGMVATVTHDRVCRVSAEPASSNLDWLLGSDGRLRHPFSGREEPGVLPAGQWVRIEGIPASLGIASDLGRFFVHEAEYDVRSGRVRLTPRV